MPFQIPRGGNTRFAFSYMQSLQGSTFISSAGGFSPNTLFTSGEAGDWFDPSDLSRMFTDTAGTTAVTADGQTVALMLGQRRGANVELAGGFSYEALAGTVPTPPAGGFVIRRSVDVTQNWILRLIGLTIGRVYRITFTAANDALEAGNTAAILAVQLGGIENVHAVGGAGTYTVFYSPTLANDGGGSIRFQCAAGNSVVVSNISVKEVALTALTQSDASARPRYKTSGGLHWLQFDGTNDYMSSASAVNFSASDKLTIAAGVLKSSDAKQTDLVGIGSPGNGAAPSALVSAPQGTAEASFGGFLAGTTGAFAARTPTTFAAPLSAVLCHQFNISGATTSDKIQQRVNGASAANTIVFGATTSGGNLGASSTLHLGARSTSNFQFTGNIYFLLIRGALTAGADITALEGFAAAKTGVTI